MAPHYEYFHRTRLILSVHNFPGNRIEQLDPGSTVFVQGHLHISGL